MSKCLRRSVIRRKFLSRWPGGIATFLSQPRRRGPKSQLTMSDTRTVVLSATIATAVAMTANALFHSLTQTTTTTTPDTIAYATTPASPARRLSSPPSPRRRSFASQSASDVRQSSSFRVQKFVLTGGPCGGKTTALARLRTFLGERGYRVFFVPEAATFLWGNGVAPQDNKCEQDWVDFQRLLMQMQIRFEDCMVERAEKACEGNDELRAIVICDRGTMDGKAYVSPEMWGSVLSSQGFDEVSIRDARYNAVLHMTTAAEGAEAFYTSENNPTRTEGVKEAQILDRKIRDAWLGHPQHIVFSNDAKEHGGEGFEAKLRSLIDHVSHILGLPTTRRKARKYLLQESPSDEAFEKESIAFRKFQIEKCYPLVLGASANDESKGYTYVRRRSEVGDQGGFAAYGETQVKLVDGERIELKRVLSHREYGIASSRAGNSNFNPLFVFWCQPLANGSLFVCFFCFPCVLLAKTSDPSRHVVRTVRTCFLIDGQSIYIERFQSPCPKITLMYVQASSGEGGDELNVPAFIRECVVREVTGQNEYSSRRISTRR